jgi:type IV secretory pathway VirB10-like protein
VEVVIMERWYRSSMGAGLVAGVALSLFAPGAAWGALAAKDVVKMVKNGVRHEVIITAIHASGTKFELGPRQLIDLHKAGVPPAVLEAMLRSGKAAPAQPEPAAEKKEEAAPPAPPPPARADAPRAEREPKTASSRDASDPWVEEERRLENERRARAEKRRQKMAEERKRDEERRRRSEEARRRRDEELRSANE